MSTVLVIDDDPDIRGLVEFKLSRARHGRSLSESNGEAGLAVAEQVLPDLVLVDWMMPRSPGSRCAGGYAPGPGPPGSCSSCSRPEPRMPTWDFGLAAGANDYIVKPFSLRNCCTA